MEKITLWGLGNELLGDDAVGMIVIKKLKALRVTDMELYICGTAPGNFLGKLKNPPDKLVLVDASDMGLKPGEFRQFGLDWVNEVSFTNHDMPLNLILGGYRDITTVIGIQPLRTAIGAPLSEALEKASDRLAKLLAERRFKDIPVLQKVKRSPR